MIPIPSEPCLPGALTHTGGYLDRIFHFLSLCLFISPHIFSVSSQVSEGLTHEEAAQLQPVLRGPSRVYQGAGGTRALLWKCTAHHTAHHTQRYGPYCSRWFFSPLPQHLFLRGENTHSSSHAHSRCFTQSVAQQRLSIYFSS